MCPACQWLVHAETLKGLAARAQELTSDGKLSEAVAAWDESLSLLPEDSQQHALVTQRKAELVSRIAADAATAPQPNAPAAHSSWWRTAGASAVGVLALLLGKFKFLLLGLTKLKTLLSMGAFFGVYWSTYGWPLALGLVLSIYIHEMGHVASLKRHGIAAGAPLFIPGVGALVLLKQRIDDPKVDAAIGLAGPVWGLGAGLAAYAVYLATGKPIWIAIAQLTGLINLFNLIPVWQLDGSRAFHALTSVQRWTVIAAMAVAYVLTRQKLLLLVGAVAVWRGFQRQQAPGDARTVTTFILLVAVLAWMSKLQGI